MNNKLPEKALLLSIKPKYAELIFNGIKTVELRKVRPNVVRGDTVLMYVTSPVMEIKASFQIKSLYSASPSKLWHMVWNKAGIEKDEFFEYFGRANIGYAIQIDSLTIFPEPLSLGTVRQQIPDFTPPQCYRYFSNIELSSLKMSFT